MLARHVTHYWVYQSTAALCGRDRARGAIERTMERDKVTCKHCLRRLGRV